MYVEVTTEILSTPAEQCGELISTTAAAREVLGNRWFLFACPPRSKKPAKDSHAHHDARSDESAMEPWLNGSASNPAIALEQSGLTVLDIDTGLGSTEQALDFAKRILLIDTMIVKTYRGYHFYFTGSRETNAKYKNGNVQGDLKSNGYVLAAGAVHPDSGKAYEVVNPGIAPAALPDTLMKYAAGTKSKRNAKARSVTPAIERGQPEYTQPEYSDKKLWAGSRYEYLRREACHLRKMGCEVAGVLAALKDICVNRCEEGEAYVRLHEDKLLGLAEHACKLPMSRIRRVASPKTQPEWWKSIVDMLTVNKPVPWSVIKTMGHGVDTHSRNALCNMRKAFDIATYRLNGVQYWELKESPEAVKQALGGVALRNLGKGSLLTPNTMGQTMHSVDTSTSWDTVLTSRRTYLRKAKQKQRAKAKAMKSQGGAQ